MKGRHWTRSEQNALEMLYRAGWRWAAISAHVSAIHGTPRSEVACQRKCSSLALTDSRRLAWKRFPDSYDDDLRDMMVLDYTTPQMARELTEQYGRHFGQGWVHKRMTELGAYYTAWRKRSGDRQSKANEQAWITRRRAS